MHNTSSLSHDCDHINTPGLVTQLPRATLDHSNCTQSQQLTSIAEKETSSPRTPSSCPSSNTRRQQKAPTAGGKGGCGAVGTHGKRAGRDVSD